MSEFASKPPSKQRESVGDFFRGGMMPAAPTEFASLLVFDLRSLKCPVEEGRKIEAAVREALFKELDERGLTKGRSAVELSGSVLGIAVD